MKRLIVALTAVISLGVAIAMATNYTVTQGSGTTFGSLVVSAVNYAQQLVCDPTTPTRCVTVSATGQASVNAASGAIASGAVASGAIASGAVASGAYASGSIASGALASGSVASGAMVDLGAQADSACSTDNGSCSLVALTKRTNQDLTTLNTSVTSAVPAGTNVIGKVGIDQTTFGTTNGVVSAANAYETVAASQTAQAMGATGATGDYLSHCIATPGTTSPGVVTILDNATAIISFAGGASSVSNLVPFVLPVGAISVSGAWKVTTGANITVVCVGKFT